MCASWCSNVIRNLVETDVTLPKSAANQRVFNVHIIEDKAIWQSNDLVWHGSPPLSLLDRRHTGRLRKRDNLLTWEGCEVVGEDCENRDFWAPKWQRAKLMDIKLPMYLFFYVALGLTDIDGGKSITRAIAGGLRNGFARIKIKKWPVELQKNWFIVKFMAGVLAEKFFPFWNFRWTYCASKTY